MAAQAAQVQEQRMQLEATTALSRKLKDFAESLAPTDGSNRDHLRKWIQDMDNIAAWTAAPEHLIIDLAGQKSQAALRGALLTAKTVFVGAQRTWNNVRNAIKGEFLERDEMTFLQQKLDRLVQEPFEDLRSYARRFIDLKNMAYPDDEAALPSVANRLITLFLGGIFDDNVRQQAARNRANRDLAAVMRDAYDIEGSFDLRRRGDRCQCRW